MITCPECNALCVDSEVFKGGGNARLGKPYPYQDDEGITHYHYDHRRYDRYSCSRGHNWAIEIPTKCEICGYEYKGE